MAFLRHRLFARSIRKLDLSALPGSILENDRRDIKTLIDDKLMDSGLSNSHRF